MTFCLFVHLLSLFSTKFFMAEFDLTSTAPVFDPKTGQPVSKYNKDLLLQKTTINRVEADYVQKNKAKVKQLAKLQEKKQAPANKMADYPNFGKVPHYIIKNESIKECKIDAQTSVGGLRKEELAEIEKEKEKDFNNKRRKNEEKRNFFTREEKRKIVMFLEEYYAKMYRTYLRLPVMIDTLRRRKRKEELENVMDEINSCVARMKSDDVVFKSEFPDTENSLLSLVYL